MFTAPQLELCLQGKQVAQTLQVAIFWSCKLNGQSLP